MFLARMWPLLTVCVILGGAVSSLRCPDGLECEGPHGCCRRPGRDGYACCDQPQFLGGSLRMLPPSTLNEESGVVCPDGRSCPLEYSCLRTLDASYGCCPYGQALSCADGHHCCPRGFHCSADGRSCFQSRGDEAGGLPASTVDAVQCPDGESQCPNESTCCLMADGTWGCCPLLEASCCEDKIHCCPHATTCDMAHSRCLSASGEQPLQTKFPAWRRASVLAGDVQCDATHKCPDGHTCCRQSSGDWGCCPLEEAVCCSDGVHCCPKGYTCNLAQGTCEAGVSSIPWLAKSSAGFVRDVTGSAASVVHCDAHSTCPDGQTCCRLASGSWGCCPFPQAVCCPDHLHCCPSGFRCGPSAGTCVKDGESIPWLEKGPAVVHSASSSGDVRCDDQVSCPDGQTCCRLASGAWGCCPLPQAVCCPDHLHCCPSGFRCGPSGTCVKDGESIPWLEKRPAIVHGARSPLSPQLLVAPVPARRVRCDDETSCPNGQTCCQLASGTWGCCPFAQALCCADHVHCCPRGYTCDVAHGSCLQSWHALPWGPKHPADPLQSQDIRCDGTTSCAEGQTCCKSKAGTWSCCQLPNAVCCADHEHCCPSGYTCNLKAQTCEKQQPQSPAAEGVQPSVSLSPSPAAESGRDVPCDTQHYCHDRQTCCQTSTGGWACCPYNKGSCCSDQRHCCPSGFRCSLSGLQCIRRGPLLRWDADMFASRSRQAVPLL